MKYQLKAEQAVQLALSIIALYLQPYSFHWWVWLLLFLAPDVSMLGYLVGPKTGAITYNLIHHKLVAGIFIAIGFPGHMPVLLLIGLLLWAHSSFDRMMGYGLKFPDSFHNTHLGLIGGKQA